MAKKKQRKKRYKKMNPLKALEFNRVNGIPPAFSKRDRDAFDKEPIWQQMEHVMKTLKAWYAVNMVWLKNDPEAKAVLNQMRDEHEEREIQIRKTVATQLKREHEQISNLFSHALEVMIREDGDDIGAERLEELVNLAKEEEHTRLDEVFARVEDQKILKNQLHSMKLEHKHLIKLSEIQTAKKRNEGRKQ